MKKITSLSNIFKKNDIYIKAKKQYLYNPYNINYERELKEVFKCTFSSEVRNIIEKVDLFSKGFKVEKCVFDVIKNGGHSDIINTFMCFNNYYENKNVWPEYCSCRKKYTNKIKKNANHRFGLYFKRIYKCAKKELNSLKQNADQEEIKKYKTILLIYKIIINTFYFSTIPKVLDIETYNKCVKEQQEFKDYYEFKSNTACYERKKTQRKIITVFNENVGWILVCRNIIRYGLGK